MRASRLRVRRPSAGLRCGIFGHRPAPSLRGLRSFTALASTLTPLPPSGLARRGRLSSDR